MTAEIAILNKSGIALAADSAVTIGTEKVYNSANKLFTLSKYHPVGIMIYDSADLLTVPWEIIIKEYRRNLADTPFEKLEDYANDFWNFIKDDNKFFTESIQNQYVTFHAYGYLDSLFKKIEEEVAKKITNNEEITIDTSVTILKNILQDDHEIIKNTIYISEFNENDEIDIISKSEKELKKCTNEVFGELVPLLSDEDLQKIYKTIVGNLVKHTFKLRTTGIVIAGYGTNEVYPRIASYFVEGVINKKVKKILVEGKSNLRSEPFATTIIPFAQDEMVWTFLSGMDPSIQEFSIEYLSQAFNKYADSLSPEGLQIGDDELKHIQRQLKSDSQLIIKEFQETIIKIQRNNNIQPILDMVEVLPKDELSAMAESLVNLTVFKRRVSKSVETVGGPIDVAIISKGDGFIWVKRKHYFDPKLNQNFFSNYFRKDC